MDLKTYIENIKFTTSIDQMKYESFNSINLNDNDIKGTLLPVPVCQAFLDMHNIIPRMSTFAIGAIINYAVSIMPPGQAYVNVGTWAGYSLFCGMAGNDNKICIGVDNFSQFTNDNPKQMFYDYFEEIKSGSHLFYEMDYQEYFRTKHQNQIGVYYYDGEHSEENQFQGLVIAEKFLADDCIIIVDDYNGLPVQIGTQRFIDQSKYNYDILFKVFTVSGSHPTFWAGMLVLKKGKRK